MLRLLIGLDRDYRGEIRVGGEAVSGPSLDRGIVFQEHRLFPWLTVQQNIGLGLENSKLTPEQKAKTSASTSSSSGSWVSRACTPINSRGAWPSAPRLPVRS